MKKKGFTLIELLVVIAIIGILASIVLVSLGSTRGQARDAKRESDIRQISLAMEMMYNDDQRYATCTPGGDGRLTETAFSDYLNPIPLDPGGGAVGACNATSGGYATFDNSGTTSEYCIWACLENGEFFAASEKGTRKLAASPTDEACW